MRLLLPYFLYLQEQGSVLQGVYISYLEIYNENGYDLLNNGFVSGRLEDLRCAIVHKTELS